MNQQALLERLKFLYDQVHQTAERAEHLSERLAYPLDPASLNYDEDLTRLQGEYNRLVRSAEADGLLSAAQLAAEGLPAQFQKG